MLSLRRVWLLKDRAACQFSDASGVKSFDEIPGPKGLPLVGTLYQYLPFIGEYDFKKLHKNGMSKYEKYGPLVREDIVQGQSTVWVFRPEDIAEVFKADVGRYPERRSHRALHKYRADRPQIYKNGGLLPTNGVEWWKLRKEFQKALSKPQNVTNYIEDTDEAMINFVGICEKNATEDTLSMLSRLFLQLLFLLTFDKKINPFSKEEMKSDSMSTKLIDAAYKTNSAILALDNGPQFWRYFNTPLYKKLCKAEEYKEEIAIKLVGEKMESLRDVEEKSAKSLLEQYLLNPELDYKDIVAFASDMLLAAIDTTTYSTSFALYHLARNSEAQEKLYAETSKLLVKEIDSITADTLREATYTKAVIKETFRMNPVSVGVGRILQEDVVLSGYQVRKGTNVVTQNQISCRLPCYFEKPDDFIPERWLKEIGTKEKPSIHPYLVLPFGHGPRSCIARRLAEQNMQMLLLRMCRHLKFEWKGGELDVITVPINKPDGPIKIHYQRR
ncbi:cytochrome P450 302a1, mitochondrial [Phymastichus coffea]|uniref:cytochrome P450 302a1, mitochondrial n=1 Tax=Phymastichus coffea TaxID=108790 RepID=UPI00273C66B3|nr:cytochrome P450 302a1, mitochondrial [Phymastichus coffea]